MDDRTLNPTHAAVAGTAIVMTCACSTSGQAAKAVALLGAAATKPVSHVIFVGIGAALVLYGLWHTRRQSALLGAAAFAVLAIAATLTPSSAMSTSMNAMHGSLPWNAVQMLGAALYVVAGGTLAYAFWRAFPSPNPAASATAMSGMVLATGCACCLVSGAVAGSAITAGASVPVFEDMQLVYWPGLAAVAVGLYRLAGPKPVALALAGGAVSRIATGIVLAKTPGVNWLQFGKYAVALAGMLALTYSFVAAYRMASVNAPDRARSFRPAVGPLEPVGGD
jgi:hypothetical protein